ncbi:hypothetical protein FBUS_01162 [Fasciolopsis buskii]|uniref:Uncharacterized protein n=1 Tax=Fasciolopsis buskii TaxID=27845 RepID=A0A8E0RPP2_9TREM|nr:hypothetical protein FBUS_01162 [Fasciolopsis buski]
MNHVVEGLPNKVLCDNKCWDEGELCKSKCRGAREFRCKMDCQKQIRLCSRSCPL